MNADKKYMNTLSEQMNMLKNEGYTEDFSIKDNYVLSNSGKKYEPEDLIINDTYRFEGESNPADSSELFAIETSDNAKGLLVLTFGALSNYNEEVIKRIKYKSQSID